MAEFDNKVALITGGSRGIGREIALELASGGCSVAVCARNAETATSVADEIEAMGQESFARGVDVVEANQVSELVEATLERWGRLDILVNNAGITRDNLLVRMKEEEWDNVMATNLKGAFNCSKAVVRPMMKARSGRIINISSVVGVSGNAGQANYAASKAGLLGFTKSLAKELASRYITVNAVAPGLVPETGMTGELGEATLEAMTANIPLGRAGTLADVAQAVSFLASDRSAYITGQVLAVDGGMTM